MEGFAIFILIVCIIFGILNLILFFKIWGATNDVDAIRKLMEKYYNLQPQQSEQHQQPEPEPILTEEEKLAREKALEAKRARAREIAVENDEQLGNLISIGVGIVAVIVIIIVIVAIIR